MGNKFPFNEAGRIATDPELSYTHSGRALVEFRLAVDDQKPDGNGGFEKSQTIFHDVTVWGATAEKVAGTLAKGDAVVINGDLAATAYTDKEGRDRTGWKVTARHIGPNLALSEVTIDRSRRAQGPLSQANNLRVQHEAQSVRQQVEGPAR